MPTDQTDLLPPERQRAISREYFLHLCATAALFVTGLVLAATVLLVPTFVFLSKSMRAKEAHLANIESAFSSTDEAALSARLTALSRNAATLSSLARAPSASATVRTALAISRPGIVLSGFVYAPVSGTRPGTLSISGVAATRDALRSYQLALSSSSFATSADLPVSAYAKDSDILFTIVVTLAP